MEYKIDIIDSIGEVVVFLMILLSVFLFTVKSSKRLSNQIFALFLLITAFDLSGFFINIDVVGHPDLQILKASSSLLQMPLFYLYVLSICYSNFIIKPQHIIHTFPFFVFIFIFKTTAISDHSLLFFEIAGEIQYFAYIIATFMALNEYKTLYSENYSNPYTSYKWLIQITILFCFGHLFVLGKTGYSYLHDDSPLLQNISILISINALFITSWIVLKALYNPKIFTGVKLELAPIELVVKEEKVKVENDTAINNAIKKLTSFMEKEKPYLDYNLSLQNLATQLNIPEKELSVLINHYLGRHFFDFINEYRVNEAKAILIHPEKKEVTVLEILYEVGFNSKSSFYTAFKKGTGRTPTQYRKEFS